MNKVNELTKNQKNREKILVANALDKVRFANGHNIFQRMCFLDLAEQSLINDAFKQHKIENYEMFGGYNEAERKALIVYPQEHIDNIKDLKSYKKNIYEQVLTILRITLPKELHGTFEHRTYLGAFMKLGVERKKIGDILVRNDGADVIISRDIEIYFSRNIKDLTRFQKANIELVPYYELKYVKPETEVMKINVSSMRLDCIVAEIAHCSRSAAEKLILEERVFVNFKEEISCSKKVEENCYITIRGKGRVKILGITGTTKSRRLTLEIEKMK